VTLNLADFLRAVQLETPGEYLTAKVLKKDEHQMTLGPLELLKGLDNPGEEDKETD